MESNKTGPLEGVRVLDLTRATAGPFASMMLGDLGAEIIKIENPPGVGGLDSRSQLDSDYQIGGDDLHFHSLNRNKKSIVLNLTKQDGKSVFYELVKVSDVVFDNFRPGVLEKLKVDFETLRVINPRIISCSNTGFGQTGPLKLSPAFDITILGRCGMLDAFNIRESDGRLACFPIPVADLLGGMWSTYAIATALYQVTKSGEGQRIDISMMDGTISLLGWLASYILNFGVARNPASQHLYGAFRTRDGEIIISAQRENFFQKLCKALNKEEWLAPDGKFNTLSKRVNGHKELRACIEEVLTHNGKEYWLARLEAFDVPCGPINSLEEALKDPQLEARNMIVTMTKNGNSVRVLGNPVKSTSIENQQYIFPPQCGEHTDEILRTVLGYDDQQIQTLKESKSIV